MDKKELYAQRDIEGSLNLFYDVMLCGRKVKTKKEQKDVDASYFAMCILIPEKKFKDIIKLLGGIEKCYNEENIDILSKIFKVEKRLLLVRLKTLSEEKKKSMNKSSSVTKKLLKK